MTREEIVRKYREAEPKKGYIQILADLNGCSKREIAEILRDAGIPLAGNFSESKKNEPFLGTATGIPGEVRDQLKQDLEKIDNDISVLQKRKTVISEFLKNNR